MAKGIKLADSETKTVSVKFPKDLVDVFDEILEGLHQRDRSYVVRQLCLKGLAVYHVDKSLEAPEMEALYYRKPKSPMMPPDDDHIA